MYRIIGGDGREYGPVTGDTIRHWVLQNRANKSTLVREENSPDWRPLGDIPEFASSFGAPPPQPQPSAPETGPAPAPVPARATVAEDLATLSATLAVRDYDLDMGRCIGGAFKLLGDKFWLVVGGTFLVMLCTTVISMIPILGIVASILLNHVFYGGLYFYYMKLVRGEPASIGDAFSGFSRSFGQLVLLSLVMNILVSIVVAPVVVPIVGIALWHWNPYVMVPVAVLFILPVLYLSVAWMFSSMLVIDRGFEFWDAMELSRKVVSKHWFLLFIFAIVAGILGAIGVIALIVGVLVTLPITFIAMVNAYETMFPRVGPNEGGTGGSA